MISRPTLGADFFEPLYRERDDPWNFVSSTYEQERFASMHAALAHRRYRHAVEPGCSIGTFTIQLTPLCDRVTALDLSPTAIDRARLRCAPFPHVQLSCAPFTRDTPVAGCDLLVLSEFGYYIDAQEWQQIASTAIPQLEPGATILLSHWLGSDPAHRQTTAEVHQPFATHPLLLLELDESHPGFRLQRFARAL